MRMLVLHHVSLLKHIFMCHLRTTHPVLSQHLYCFIVVVSFDSS